MVVHVMHKIFIFMERLGNQNNDIKIFQIDFECSPWPGVLLTITDVSYSVAESSHNQSVHHLAVAGDVELV